MKVQILVLVIVNMIIHVYQVIPEIVIVIHIGIYKHALNQFLVIMVVQIQLLQIMTHVQI